MENDLIRRSDALKAIGSDAISHYPSTFAPGLVAAENEIAAVPAVDAVEVRHGRWIDWAGNDVTFDEYGCPEQSAWCSECHDWLSASDEYSVRGRFCPNCGAKMDGRREEGDGDG